MSARAEEQNDRPRTAGEMLAKAREFLAKKDVPEARLEAELLVAFALGLDRLHLFLALDRPIVDSELVKAREVLVRRAKREPTAYIVGKREFYGRSFEVNRAVLIPRPETELLVDAAREIFASSSSPLAIADIGTGSGCLAITLALELESAEVSAVDLSRDALEVARKNAERLGAKVRFVEGDGPRALELAPQSLDLVVSNPPYVETAERASLAPEVRDHEPELALFAPDGDPDHWVKRLLDEALPLVKSGGAMLIELGHRQSERALQLALAVAKSATLRSDLDRVPRVLELRAR